MKKILILGAGRSSPYLIDYLLSAAEKYNWEVTVGDFSKELAESRAGKFPFGKGIAFDVSDESQRGQLIRESDIVVSLLPPSMHIAIARECLRFRKNMVTASYVSDEMRALDKEAAAAGIVIMNEVGLDPGIDHMSAMKIIDGIKAAGGELLSFRSYCGGLIAPESNDNPWGYKFTWNPRNVILAGQGTARYIRNGKYRYIPYNRLFREIDRIEVKGGGKFEAYANRDSLSYRHPYGLENIPTMLRGTLRSPGFCESWNALVALGFTDDSYTVENSAGLTYREFMEAYLGSYAEGRSLRKALAEFLSVGQNSEVVDRIIWMGLTEDKRIGLENATPAQILQVLLEEKLKLGENDRDMVVMQHQFEYTAGGKVKRILSSLVVKGEDSNYTAMAKTVGLPAAITARLILTGEIRSTGVLIPTFREVYEPVLNELSEYGIKFQEEESDIS